MPWPEAHLGRSQQCVHDVLQPRALCTEQLHLHVNSGELLLTLAKMDVIQVWVTVAMVRNVPAAAGCLGAVYPLPLLTITQCVDPVVSQ